MCCLLLYPWLLVVVLWNFQLYPWYHDFLPMCSFSGLYFCCGFYRLVFVLYLVFFVVVYCAESVFVESCFSVIIVSFSSFNVVFYFIICFLSFSIYFRVWCNYFYRFYCLCSYILFFYSCTCVVCISRRDTNDTYKY